jgi:hypothetical protein
MKQILLWVLGAAAVVLGVAVLLRPGILPFWNQDSAVIADETVVARAGPAPKTAWGEPDLQGIWTDEFQTPLERRARDADKEFLTDAERAEIDKQRTTPPTTPVIGAYSAVFQSQRPTGRRTSLVVDPPNGRIPPLTPEAKKRIAIEREYLLALMQATETCRKQAAENRGATDAPVGGFGNCAGGKYGPPSPRRAEPPPFLNTDVINRLDGPEDLGMPTRCMGAGLPDFGGYRRIVQSPGAVSIFYDVGQGQGWERVIPVNGSRHLPPTIRQRFGDSRGRWEGNTLVVDVTNFSPKHDFRESRENLHLVERWTRLDANTLEYAVTIEDATTWTSPWTVKQEMTRQNDELNRIYYEPRCHEGNYGLPAILAGGRAQDKAFREGKGPDPATLDQTLAFGAVPVQ